MNLHTKWAQISLDLSRWKSMWLVAHPPADTKCKRYRLTIVPTCSSSSSFCQNIVLYRKPNKPRYLRSMTLQTCDMCCRWRTMALAWSCWNATQPPRQGHIWRNSIWHVQSQISWARHTMLPWPCQELICKIWGESVWHTIISVKSTPSYGELPISCPYQH